MISRAQGSVPVVGDGAGDLAGNAEAGGCSGLPSRDDHGRDLLARARAGDVQALHALYLRFTPLLRAALAPYRHDRELYDELPGELYLVFHHLVVRYDVRRGVQFTTYLARMVETLLWSVVRRHRRVARREVPASQVPALADEEETPLSLWPNGGGPPDRPLLGPGGAIRVEMTEEEIIDRMVWKEALTRLTARQREIWRLRQAGYAFAEIAAGVGLGVAACRQAFRRARVVLQTAMDDERDGPGERE